MFHRNIEIPVFQSTVLVLSIFAIQDFSAFEYGISGQVFLQCIVWRTFNEQATLYTTVNIPKNVKVTFMVFDQFVKE